MAQLLITVTFGLIILTVATAARILLIHPFPSKSHAGFNDAIAKSLLDAGHHITAISCFPESIIHENYTAIDALFFESSNNTNSVNIAPLLELSSALDLIDLMLVTSAKSCNETIRLKEVQQLMKSKEKSVDLVMIDIFAYMFECFLPIADQLDVPVIGTIASRSWRHTEWNIGNPYNPAVIPFELSYNPVKTTFFQRMSNLWGCLVDHLYQNYVIHQKVEAFYQQWFADSPNTRRNPSLLFVNGLTIFNSRPLLPTVINVGGIHVEPEKPLPKDLQSFIDDADHGVILFSVGSVVQSHTMPVNILSIFREVFAEIPQRVIWKAEEKIESLSDNILLCKWLPQRDILAQENVVAFISHSGISGIYEALYSGVPVISMPLFFDQMSNAAILQELGVGIRLDVHTMTKEKLWRALNDVINGTKYKNRVKELSALIQDQPMSSAKAVTFWTEYVIRHNGTEHMKTQSTTMPIYQYLLFDVLLPVLLVIFMAILGIYYLLKTICYNRLHRFALLIHFKKQD